MNPELLKELIDVHGLTEEQAGKIAALGVVTRDDMSHLTEGDFTGCAITIVAARKLVTAYKPAAVSAASAGAAGLGFLPVVPDDESFIQMLKVGGDLKVGQGEVIAAIKAALAEQAGLFDLPELLSEAMESYQIAQSLPAGPGFFTIDRALREKKYGEVLSVLKVEGASTYVSKTRKDELLRRVRTILWPSLRNFFSQVEVWKDAYMSGAGNPALIMASALGSAAGGGMAAAAGLMDSDITVLRTAAETVNNDANRVFAGPGVIVARAFASDAVRYNAVLNDPAVLVETGFPGREQLLRGIGLEATSDLISAEQNLVRFALGIMSISKVPPDAEALFAVTLWQVGNKIPWDLLDISEKGNGKATSRPASVVPRTPLRDGQRVRPSEL